MHILVSSLLPAVEQVYGKADVAHAVHALSGSAKKAAGEALQKALSSAAASKAAVPALDVAGVASYAISVSCEASPTAPAPQQHFSAVEQVGCPLLPTAKPQTCWRCSLDTAPELEWLRAMQRASAPSQQPSTAPASSSRRSSVAAPQQPSLALSQRKEERAKR